KYSSFRGSGAAREPGTHMWTAPALQGLAARMTVLVDCGHMSGLCVRHEWPLAQMGYADRVPNREVMSEHRWVPRVVPILGPTDRHLAVSLQAPEAVVRVSGSGRLRSAVEFAAHQHGPDDAGHLVGQRDRRELLR